MGRLAPSGIVGDEKKADAPPAAASKEAWKKAAEPLTTIVNWYTNHAALGTLLLGAFLVVKGFVLSKGDIPIALGILRNAGLPTVVIGGLLSGLPILVAAMLAITIVHGITRDREGNIFGDLTRNLKRPALGGLPVSPLAAVMLTTAVLSVVFTQWPFMVAAVVIGLVIGAIQRTKGPWLKRAAYLVTLVIAVYAVIVMLYTVWLPHEELTITGVKEPVVGYVLSDDPDGWISILLSREHGIVWHRDTDVIMRQPCELAPDSFLSQFRDAATICQEITKVRGLTFLHPAVEPAC